MRLRVTRGLKRFISMPKYPFWVDFKLLFSLNSLDGAKVRRGLHKEACFCKEALNLRSPPP